MRTIIYFGCFARRNNRRRDPAHIRFDVRFVRYDDEAETQRGPAGTSRIDSTATPKAGWLFSVPMCWLFSVPMYGTRRLHHFFSPV
jgi:hypothetical protein